ncbi:uncharacterized protein LOC106078689 isoform X2 [Biomphalaria glabrata]|uniref:Uncharacterized protein LOC106078689 isoform X2 n=1 Tax=Biomphalaria glabrata TaxID=6526 RepID=A0A9U8EN82_BIOGL|nr:uncharacterized protein LOC106078689 isoform X2 [Biomphalaria glabrata]
MLIYNLLCELVTLGLSWVRDYLETENQLVRGFHKGRTYLIHRDIDCGLFAGLNLVHELFNDIITMVRDRINDIRKLVNGKRVFFMENLESDLFIEGFPGLQPFTRNRLRSYLKSDGESHANSYLLDAMLKVDNFPEKFIKFCDNYECCTDLRNLILEEVNRTSSRLNSTSAHTCSFNSRNISSEASNGEHTQATMAIHKQSEQENNLNQNEIACEMNLDAARNMKEELIMPSSNEALVLQEDHNKQKDDAPCTLMAGLNNNSQGANKLSMLDKELSDLTSAGSQGSDDSYYLTDSDTTDCVEPNHEIDSLKETVPKNISECDDDTQYMSTLNVSEKGNNSKINTAIAAGKLTNDDALSSGIHGEGLEKEKQSMAVLNISNSSAEDGSNSNFSLSVMSEKLEPCSQTEVKKLFDGHCEEKECLDDFSTFTDSILSDFPEILKETCEEPGVSERSEAAASSDSAISQNGIPLSQSLIRE